MSDGEPGSDWTRVEGGVQSDHGSASAGRDISGGVHTGPEYVTNNYINVADLRDADELLEALQMVKQDGQKSGSGGVPPMAAGAGANGMPMQSFQAQAADPYQGGAQWLPQLQQVAAQQGSAWVPTQTHGAGGIDLTGVWVPPGGMEQDYVRQSGPYVNMIIGVGGVQTGYSEGLFDPASGIIRLAGMYANGARLEAQLQLFPNWTLQGSVTGFGPFGPMTTPVFLMRAA